MPRAVRFVIAFVLALAVPWQAVAAATMNDVPAPAGHEHRMGGHEHAGADRAAPHGDHGHHGDHGNRAGSAKAKCGAGSSCCAAAALPSMQAPFDAAALSQRLAAPGPVDVAPFLTSGLDRPPRLRLA